MVQLRWYDEERWDQDNDPGKDIFALLFLAFFLINAVVLFCVSGKSEQTTRVNTAGAGQERLMEAGQIARLGKRSGQISITQENQTYLMPQDLKRFQKEGRFSRLDILNIVITF